MPSLEKIKSLVVSYKESYVRDLTELVNVPSALNVDGYDLVLKKYKKVATNLGLNIDILEDPDYEHAIFIGKDFNKSVGTVFITDYATPYLDYENIDGIDPYKPRILENKLIGLGSFNCKSIATALIYAKKILADLGHDDLMKILLQDRSSSAQGREGIKLALDSGFKAKNFYAAGPMIIENGIGILSHGSRGYFRLKICCYGESVHAGSLKWQKEELGANAVEALYRLWEAAKNILGENKPDPVFRDGIANKQTLLSLSGGNLGSSIVPAYAEAMIELRSVGNVSHSQYLKDFEDLAKKMYQNSKFLFKFIVIKDHEPQNFEITSLVKAYQKNLQSKVDYEVQIKCDNYLTSFYIFKEYGLSYGEIKMLEGGDVRTTKEWVDLDSVDKYLPIFIQSILEDNQIEVTE